MAEYVQVFDFGVSGSLTTSSWSRRGEEPRRHAPPRGANARAAGEPDPLIQVCTALAEAHRLGIVHPTSSPRT